MGDDTIQAHEGDGSDTLSSTRTPIIFVPGVMGSRLFLGDSRTWDPDSPTTRVLRWVPLTNAGVQTNRAALSVAVTQSAPVTELVSDAKKAISKNTAVSGVAKREMGLKDAPSSDQIQEFFGVRRNWATVLWTFYGQILMRIEGEFNATRTANPVYAFGYDFRQSNATNGAKLLTFVADTLSKHPAAKQVILVTHSMGGLVVRGAIAHAALVGDASFLDKIRGVIQGAQPSNGAVVCYTRFLSGVSAPVEPIGFFDLEQSVLSTILGQTGNEYSYLLSGLPGPLQLLPNHKYQASFGSGKWLDGLDAGADLNDVFSIYVGSGPAGLTDKVSFAQALLGTDDERNGQTVIKEFARNLQSARIFHEQLANAPDAAFHPHTVALFSTGLETLYSVRVNTDKDAIDLHRQFSSKGLNGGGVEITDHWAKIAYSRKPLGDGTVPDVSGRCPAAQGAIVEQAAGAVEHSKLYRNEGVNQRVIFYVKQLLQGPPAHADNEAGASSDEMLASNDDDGFDGGDYGDSDPETDNTANDGDDEAVA